MSETLTRHDEHVRKMYRETEFCGREIQFRDTFSREANE
jgi:hypothetical protein